MSHTAEEVARGVDGRLVGDPGRPLSAIRTLDEAGPEDLSFLGNPRYVEQARRSAAGVLLCAPDAGLPDQRPRIEVAFVLDTTGSMSNLIAGAKAKYKGDGSINGSGNYGFMLTATDGQINVCADPI